MTTTQNTAGQAIDYDQYLVICEHDGCEMRFFHLPQHEAANRPRLCGDHMAEHMRYEQNQQGHPHWSVD
jgi:hypothetical protein